MEVWESLCRILYGQTATYADVACQTTVKRVREHMSAQAVGGAIAHNPIPIIVSCHRVIRTSGDVGGYAVGEKKTLLRLEYLPAGTPINRILMDVDTIRGTLEEV